MRTETTLKELWDRVIRQFRGLVFSVDHIIAAKGSLKQLWEAQILVEQMQQLKQNRPMVVVTLLKGYVEMAERILAREVEARMQVGDEHGEGAKAHFYDKLQGPAYDIAMLLKKFRQNVELYRLPEPHQHRLLSLISKVEGDERFMGVLEDTGVLDLVREIQFR